MQFPLVIPIIFLVVVAFLLVVPLYAAPRDTGMGVLITCTGIPVYVLGVMWKRKPKAFNNLVRKNCTHVSFEQSPCLNNTDSATKVLDSWLEVFTLQPGWDFFILRVSNLGHDLMSADLFTVV